MNSFPLSEVKVLRVSFGSSLQSCSMAENMALAALSGILKAKIAEMREKAPNATMDITGHSLGTIVSAQGVAGLSDEELEKIGKVVLFDGPDTTKSLKKMGLSDEKIKKISEKIEYYVNPFDIVGMINREHTITKLPGNL